MKRIVECVPNISEGRDRSVIDAVLAEVKAVPGAVLLDADPGPDTNRTVITFAGEPGPVMEAAFRVIKRASELIDMTKHKGAHPRMGATDVCPFVPVSGVTMDDCVSYAKEVGERAGELGIPIYLYEYAATRPERRNLSDIRKGEYEALPEKLGTKEWEPDFGPNRFNPSAGATAVGARNFLIAFNINFNARDEKRVHRIAKMIRESGCPARDEDGRLILDENGAQVITPGLFQNLKAVGWWLAERRIAQLSMNFTNHKTTQLHDVYVKVMELAAEQGLIVTGSELVGLVPLDAMVAAGRFFAARQKRCEGMPISRLIRLAVHSMGMEEFGPFDPKKKIIEYAIDDTPRPLAALSIRDFADELAGDSPAPGGGSVAALAGAMGAGLAAMVPNLTIGKRQFLDVKDELNASSIEAQDLKDRLLDAIDDDTAAFNRLLDAFRMPQGTPEEVEERKAAIGAAIREATMVPLSTLKHAARAVELAGIAARKGNPNALSDGGVGAQVSLAAAEGAYYNVLINLRSIKSKKFRAEVTAEAEESIARARKAAREIAEYVESSLKSEIKAAAKSAGEDEDEDEA
ncbi:MAG: glutamate formimidoyltransferase [bacterium]|jgi:glutamate formiminotransferase/formiminotetrahydrofolate cyclodeaminase